MKNSALPESKRQEIIETIKPRDSAFTDELLVVSKKGGWITDHVPILQSIS